MYIKIQISNRARWKTIFPGLPRGRKASFLQICLMENLNPILKNSSALGGILMTIPPRSLLKD